ncbi:hypothetical protein J3F83DRAFT_747850 [Trichoderma novae-zelandiae]
MPDACRCIHAAALGSPAVTPLLLLVTITITDTITFILLLLLLRLLITMTPPPCSHLAVISGLLHLTAPVTRCCPSGRQSIGGFFQLPLGHASDAGLTLFASRINAQTTPAPGTFWHPPLGSGACPPYLLVGT